MKKETVKKRIMENLRVTYKNKILAVGLMFLGWLSTFIDGDATFFVFSLIAGIPMFLATDNIIY